MLRRLSVAEVGAGGMWQRRWLVGVLVMATLAVLPAAPVAARVADESGVSTGAVASVSFGGGGFESLVPARLFDTRDGTGPPVGTVPGGATVELQVAGRGGVPAVGAGAVVLNVTAVTPAASGFVTVFPTGAARPVASNLNFVGGQVVPNLVVAKLGVGGKVSLYNAPGSGPIHLVADVAGWFPEVLGIEPLVPTAGARHA